MDQSAEEARSPRATNPAHRDMMFCHECHDEWFRDEHGLACPECGSEFTEIIEDQNDPRDNSMSDHDDENESMHSLDDDATGPHPHHHHTHHHHMPWREHDDPEEADISNLQWRQLGPGRFAVTGTMYRTVSPGQMNRGGDAQHGPSAIGGFASLLNSIIGGTRPQSQNEGHNPGAQNPNDQESGGNDTPSATPGSGSGTLPGGHRFTYTSGARLYPRNPDNPGPHIEPVDELNNVLVGLMAAFGEPPGNSPNGARGHTHAHVHGPPGPDGNPHAHALNPLLHLFSQMMPGNGRFGDAVYSQEGLDRIISQLMEQNASSNAPGPATENDINSLPRKPVTVDMLGPEGRAECSICMDEVDIGEEVTQLPCTHWFHHACVAAWLSEHDTCPHCRKGISKHDGNAQNPPGHPPNDTGGGGDGGGGGQSSGPYPYPPQVPGSFTTSGEGTPNAPYFTPEGPGSNNYQSNNFSSVYGQAQTASSPHEDSGSAGGGNGIGERLRRGLFGPQR